MRRKKDWILRTRFSRIFFSGASHSRIRSSLRQKRFIDLPLIRGIPRFERVNAKGREGGGAEARGRSETKEEEEGTRAGWCRIVWQLFFPVISRRHRQIQPRDRSQKLVSCLRSSSSSSSHPSRDRHNESHWQPLINTILNTVLRFLGKGWSCFWDKADARSSSPRSDDHPSLRPLTFRLEKRSNRECFFSFFPSLFPSKKIPFSSVMSFSLKLFFRSLSSRTGSLFPDVTKQSLENGQISLEHGVGTHFTTDNRPTFSTMIHDRRGWSPPRAITFPLLIAGAEKTDCNLSSVIGLIIKTGENYLSTISSSISSKPIGKLSIDPFRFETIRDTKIEKEFFRCNSRTETFFFFIFSRIPYLNIPSKYIRIFWNNSTTNEENLEQSSLKKKTSSRWMKNSKRSSMRREEASHGIVIVAKRINGYTPVARQRSRIPLVIPERSIGVGWWHRKQALSLPSLSLPIALRGRRDRGGRRRTERFDRGVNETRTATTTHTTRARPYTRRSEERRKRRRRKRERRRRRGWVVSQGGPWH